VASVTPAQTGDSTIDVKHAQSAAVAHAPLAAASRAWNAALRSAHAEAAASGRPASAVAGDPPASCVAAGTAGTAGTGEEVVAVADGVAEPSDRRSSLPRARVQEHSTA